MQTYTKKDLRAIGLTILAVAIIAAQGIFIATSLYRLETATKKNHSGIILVGDCPGGGTAC
jgi:hypothetical protein